MEHAFRVELGVAGWRKSSFSDTGGGSCVEVGDGVPVLVFPGGAWAAVVRTA
ncbi:DUF397 domain-containing protein [Streptomyces hainanensis]|uniref:DUF397 domain-containing protein n=1 Tax=Streptomyces hainanensis TaxID=402648 RepID=A0A4R4TMV4_9ACTN|nr:DUF397 domain-containing protein [Streptomyces hainanensis]